MSEWNEKWRKEGKNEELKSQRGKQITMRTTDYVKTMNL
jgi:hypothetical protein